MSYLIDFIFALLIAAITAVQSEQKKRIRIFIIFAIGIWALSIVRTDLLSYFSRPDPELNVRKNGNIITFKVTNNSKPIKSLTLEFTLSGDIKNVTYNTLTQSSGTPEIFVTDEVGFTIKALSLKKNTHMISSNRVKIVIDDFDENDSFWAQIYTQKQKCDYEVPNIIEAVRFTYRWFDSGTIKASTKYLNITAQSTETVSTSTSTKMICEKSGWGLAKSGGYRSAGQAPYISLEKFQHEKGIKPNSEGFNLNKEE